MFKKFTYKQKVKILPIVLCVALLFVYLFAIRETLTAKRECNNLTEQIKTAGDAPQQIGLIQSKLEELNKIMGKDTILSGTDPLLEFISTSNADMRINLVDYMPMHIYEYQNYQIETRTAVFEGTYIRLLKFLSHLETDYKSGKVVSVKFESETNYKTNKKRLLMSIFVQSVLNKEKKDGKLQSKQENN